MLIDRFLFSANWLLFALTGLYAYSMLLHPWLKGGWKYVHAVWYDWQSLNVGILAFLASVIAFNISRHHAAQQRRRELVAARSFLPESLSELSEYLRRCSVVLCSAYSGTKQTHAQLSQDQLPRLPSGYKEIFSRCISLADKELAEHLSYILACLQIHHARISSLLEEQRPNSRFVVTRHNVLTYIYRLGELQALVNNTFDYARGEKEFIAKPLDFSSYKTAYANLGTHLHNIDDLEDFTKHAIERNAKQNI
ncbi:hypothetical protein [Simplicispira lacusdiani]|uniref:hypothetical protein n=1 Tax=Simplicispira lacusdiani TaxID=2213010 RepID=UPI001300AFD3|nr:hypothetical protein [Simplicispira lacusdiani]